MAANITLFAQAIATLPKKIVKGLSEAPFKSTVTYQNRHWSSGVFKEIYSRRDAKLCVSTKGIERVAVATSPDERN